MDPNKVGLLAATAGFLRYACLCFMTGFGFGTGALAAWQLYRAIQNREWKRKPTEKVGSAPRGPIAPELRRPKGAALH
jgi:hypothetical protein